MQSTMTLEGCGKVFHPLEIRWEQLPLVLLLGGALLVSAACGKVRKDESWNSYYYGGYQEMNGKFTYTGEGDNDSHYKHPSHVSGPSTGAPSMSGTDKSMMDVRPMMKSSDGHNR